MGDSIRIILTLAAFMIVISIFGFLADSCERNGESEPEHVTYYVRGTELISVFDEENIEKQTIFDFSDICPNVFYCKKEEQINLDSLKKVNPERLLINEDASNFDSRLLTIVNLQQLQSGKFYASDLLESRKIGFSPIPAFNVSNPDDPSSAIIQNSTGKILLLEGVRYTKIGSEQSKSNSITKIYPGETRYVHGGPDYFFDNSPPVTIQTSSDAIVTIKNWLHFEE